MNQGKKPDEIYCQSCGNLISEKAVMCPKCGFMVKSIPRTVAIGDRINPMAIISLITGIVSLPCGWLWGAGIVFAIPAIILGILDLRNINKCKSSSRGKGFDIAGIVCGGLSIFSFIIVIVLFLIGISSGY
ncbi:unnamed protein product [marine sediment metagenome]|uniref:DUF4190 domain-containing protein n=2 Tax=marine sediment metagenome TaxID=412755 RepID=X1HWV8_9ZZZZ